MNAKKEKNETESESKNSDSSCGTKIYESRYKILEPFVFNSNLEADPEEWINRYDLYSRRLQWSDGDKVDILELYLDKKERNWYKNKKSTFISWEETKKLFLENFAGKESEIKAWVSLQEIKQEIYADIDEFEMELNILFGKAKILDSNAKWRCLMAALNPKYQKLILREKLADFEKAVELVREEANLYKLVDSHKYPSERQEQTLKASETVVVKDHGSGNQDMYEALTKKFEELSINLITKIEHATNLQYNKCRTDRESYDYRNKLFCYRCKRDCNRSWDCQDNRQFQIVRDEKKNQNITEHNSVGCIDLEEGCHEMLKPDSSEVNIVDKRSRDELTEDEVLRDKLRKTSESNEVVHLIARNPEKYTAVRKRNDFGIRMEDSIDRYSIKSDLTLNKPKINFAQLLQASPAIRTELLNLCKRVEVKNFNSIDNRSDNVTNCKAIVEIFGNYYWAIMDTGAACSVISEELLEELGLGPDFVNNQVIVTADGTKHATLGGI
ncbi:hypothetical protein AYI69_g10799 [Smittium culicis]|uniref:Retrotransposon gag domain-containing protein n=1 Tax=Smittium culicis TaxID=133412 RepID=A0A1R1X3E2_9FUNG|nr:hypothetical protein AYI69_g10799 [Smittium culicis]